MDKPETEEKDTEKGIVTIVFSLSLTPDLQNKKVMIGTKITKAGVDSIYYSTEIDIGTICKETLIIVFVYWLLMIMCYEMIHSTNLFIVISHERT